MYRHEMWVAIHQAGVIGIFTALYRVSIAAEATDIEPDGEAGWFEGYRLLFEIAPLGLALVVISLVALLGARRQLEAME